MEDCIFCAIAAGRAPAEILCQEEAALAFLDVQPAAPGHTLVIPRVHWQAIWEIDEETGAVLMELVARVGRALRQALQPDGLAVLQNNGRAAGQVVPHLHVHLIPRWYGDGLPLARGQLARNAEPLDAVAARVRAALHG